MVVLHERHIDITDVLISIRVKIPVQIRLRVRGEVMRNCDYIISHYNRAG